EKGHVWQPSAKLEDSTLDQWPAGVELPQSGVSAARPSMRPQRRGVPACFHGYRATLAHPRFEAGEEALELAQSASEQGVNVASWRTAGRKVGRRGGGTAPNDRDLVEALAQTGGGAHPRQTAADHQSASGAHGPLPTRPANPAALMRRPEPATLVRKIAAR